MCVLSIHSFKLTSALQLCMGSRQQQTQHEVHAGTEHSAYMLHCAGHWKSSYVL